MIKIRQTTDLDTIKDLDQRIFNLPKQLDTDGTWWIAYDGNLPVGFAGCKVLKREPYAYMLRAGVLSSHRGLGIHNKLIKVRLAWAKKQNVQGAMTYTLVWNHASSNNLMDYGFRLFKPSWPWVGTKDVLYWFKGFDK